MDLGFHFASHTSESEIQNIHTTNSFPVTPVFSNTPRYMHYV